MRPELQLYKAGINVVTGLTHIRCPQCGHAGLMAGEGLHLVFRAGQQYCFTFGTIPAHLTVSITTEAIFAYQWLGLSQETLARYAAEWLLLLGRNAGVFLLAPDQPAFVGFPRYLQSHVGSSVRPNVA
ncbi:MAG: hypothetical protein AB7G68_05960 [Nitrospiraceae bacterium]